MALVATQEMRAWLKTIPAQETGVPGAVIRIESKDPLSRALQTMALHRVLCLPLHNLQTGQAIGLVDMNDIVAYVTDHTAQFFQTHGSTNAENTEKLLGSWAATGLMQEPVEKVANYSGANPFFYLQPSASLFDALELMLSRRTHRIGLVDEAGRLVNLLTQSSILAYLAKQEPRLSHISAKKMSELVSVATTHKQISIHEDKRAIDAFELMKKEKVSAVAVVDTSNKLVANLSNRDFKQIGYNANAFDSLYKPIREYLHAEQKWRLRDLFATGVISFQEQETFGRVLERVVKNRIHRIYQTDGHGHVKAIVSLSDMLRMLLAFG